jgi:hypothetical protein
MADGSRSVIPTWSRDLSAPERRMLGFLAAHPGWWAARTDGHRSTIKSLLQRLAVKREHREEEAKGRTKNVVRAKVLPHGIDMARELGLVCPGRESGECEECRRAVAGERGEG